MHECNKHAEWCDGGVLLCKKCGEILAQRYKMGEEVKVIVKPRFIQYAQDIKDRKDTQSIASDRDLLANLSFSEFDNLLCDIRSNQSDLLSIQEGFEWSDYDGESEVSGGVRELDDVDDEGFTKTMEKLRDSLTRLRKPILFD